MGCSGSKPDEDAAKDDAAAEIQEAVSWASIGRHTQQKHLRASSHAP